METFPGTNGRAFILSLARLSSSDPSTGVVGGFGGMFGDMPPRRYLSGVALRVAGDFK